MKILAGIPTRKRSTSGKIAQTLAEVADDVVIISQGAETWCDANYGRLDRIHVVEYPENFGLVPARNEILKFAVDGGYDYVIQSDDDIFFTSEIVELMVEIIQKYPTLGGLASEPRAYFNWNKDVECTLPFLLAPCTPQFWISRTEILTEVGPWSLPYLEDREHGCRLWKAGYPLGQLHVSLDYTHNPFIARTNTENKAVEGGQEEQIGEEKHAGLKKAIEYMQEHHSDVMMIKYMGLSGRSFMTRYDWNRLLEFPTKRFGKVLGYADSKGRFL